MPQAAGLVVGGRAQFLREGRNLRAQSFDVDTGAAGPVILEREEGLGDEIERAPAAAAFETQMERCGDAIERTDQIPQVRLRSGEDMIESLSRGEIIAVVEYLYRAIEAGFHAG